MSAVWLHDPNLKRIALLDDYSLLKASLKHQKVSNWQLDISEATSEAAAIMRAAALDETLWKYGLEVTPDPEIGFEGFSGPFARVGRRRNSKVNTRNLTGFDDTVWLARRLALPSAAPYTADDYDHQHGRAEPVIRHYVSYNCGPSAATGRPVPGLTLEPDQDRSPVIVTVDARMKPVLDVITPPAIASGLGFKIQRVNGALLYSMYSPVDRSDTIVYSIEYETVKGFAYATEGPKANYIIAGAQGEGTSRKFREGGDAASIAIYGRREAFIDARDTNDDAVIDERIAAALIEYGATSSLSTEPFLQSGQIPGRGDIVKAKIDGVTITDTVQEIVFESVAGEPPRLAPVLGTAGATNPLVPSLFRKQREADARLVNLEVR